MFNQKNIKAAYILLLIGMFVLTACTQSTSQQGQNSVKTDENGEITAYILELNIEENSLLIDPVEWLTPEDEERLNELNLNAARDLPTGFKVHNEVEEKESYPLSTDADLYILDLEDLPREKKVDKEELAVRIDYQPSPYVLKIQEGTIIEVRERYLP
ncbi:hypothetical protein [Alkaliphilus crotonatoxidans]